MDKKTTDESKKDILTRNQLIIALCHSAGSFHGRALEKAIQIMQTADEILKQIKEGN